MTVQGWLLILIFTALVLAMAKPVGMALFAVYEGHRTPLTIVLGPIERGFYRLAGIDPEADQSWQGYAAAVMVFSVVGIALLMGLLMLQGALPLNPLGLPGLSWHLAFNTAVSFVTNTNWQSYGGRIDDEQPQPDGGADRPGISCRLRPASPSPSPSSAASPGARRQASAISGPI